MYTDTEGGGGEDGWILAGFNTNYKTRQIQFIKTNLRYMTTMRG